MAYCRKPLRDNFNYVDIVSHKPRIDQL